VDDPIKENEMGRVWAMYWGEDKYIQRFGGEI
jgi:hypothetical protein